MARAGCDVELQTRVLLYGQMSSRFAHLGSNAHAIAFHARCCVDSVAKQTVARVGCAHYSCYYWPTVNSYLKADAPIKTLTC